MSRGRAWLVVHLALVACGRDELPPCGDPPYFTVLPVAPEDMSAVTVFGGLGAPGHTLPTPHAGIALARAGVTVRSPGELRATRVRRVTYLASPARQGVTDYALEFSACREVTGWFGHLTSLSEAIPADQIEWTRCDTYSTSDETVETCSGIPGPIRLAAGVEIGTGGLSAELGFLGLDVGLLDSRVEHGYIARDRYPPPTFHAVCPWEVFDAANQEVLFSRLRDPARPALVPAGSPRCGTMQVDVAGTAKGVWVEPGFTGPLGGDERRFVTLADDPYGPQARLALSLGPAGLGATVAIVPRLTTGRVNRAFEDVAEEGIIHCYGPAAGPGTPSWLLSLAPGGTLSIERIAGATPCAADPSTWAFGAGKATLVR